MALFQRYDRNDQLVKITQEKPLVSADDEGFFKLIIGLGNIGKQYEDTRHNSGFMTVDAFAKTNDFPAWQEKNKFKAFITEDFVAGKKVILAKPTTFYNLSGACVQALKDFYKLSNKDIVVIHDELDLPFGTVKEKQGGGSAGSNGLKSIISHIGEDFKRIRIGISNETLEQFDPADFVLSKFSAAEKKQLDEVIKTAVKKI